jgi:prolyl-tRNA editing enzyme YbaK/EbsC (Cys-tRNA(Pro) deacylase)
VLAAYETVLVGGGAVGIEVELAPADLLRLTGGTVLPLVIGAAPPPPSSGDTSV